MGTNFYVNAPACDCPCPHCSAPERPHIGKRSAGWQFTFSALYGPKSWAEWKDVIWEVAEERFPVVDEYGRKYGPDEFMGLVDATRGRHEHDAVGDPYLPPDSWFFDADGWFFWNREFS